MSAKVEYLSNKASMEDVEKHLRNCDADFVPSLSSRVEITDYAHKIVSKATRFEAWFGGILVGLVAVYCNDQEKSIAYVTSVSLMKEWVGKGIALHLMRQCIKHMHVLGMRQICLEVASDNKPAIKLYEKCGFVAGNTNAPFVTMNLYFKSGDEYE
jgi:ribosomal protein S18 acetylase RimI-like enzyme